MMFDLRNIFAVPKNFLKKLKIYCTCSEDIATSVTSGCELSIVAWPTVDPIGLGPKLLVN